MYIGSTDFNLEVTKGSIPKHTFIHKFGENPTIDNLATFKDIWDAGGTYVPPTQARIHAIVSTDVNDAGTVVSTGTVTGGDTRVLVDSSATFVSDGVQVGDAILNDTCVEIGFVTAVTSETELGILSEMRDPGSGFPDIGNTAGDTYRIVNADSTGCPVFFVTGLNASLLEISEFVVLNGQTPVNTVKTYFRQYRARAFYQSGIGVITSTAAVDGTISCQIIDGNNQTLMAIYTIPSNKVGYLRSWWGTLSKKTGAAVEMHLRVGQLHGVGYIINSRGLSSTGSSQFTFDYIPPDVLVGGADIWVEASSDTVNVGVAAGFDIILIDK